MTTSTTRLDAKKAALKAKETALVRARQRLVEAEAKEVTAAEKLFKERCRRISDYCLAQPIKSFKIVNGKHTLAVDEEATRAVRKRLSRITALLNMGMPPADIIQALIEHLINEKNRLDPCHKVER